MALPVRCRGVMEGEEDLEQLPVGDHGAVELDQQDFSMARRVAADPLIGWVLLPPSGMAADDPFDALQAAEDSVHASEAAPAEDRQPLQAIGGGPVP